MAMTQRTALGRESVLVSILSLTCGSLFLSATSPVRAAVLVDGITPYTQNFDTLLATGSTNPWVDNSTLSGWYAMYTGSGGIPTTYRAITLASGNNSTGIMSFNDGATPLNLAFGGRGGGSTVSEIRYGVILQNNSAATLDTVSISYTGEQWQTTGAGTTGDTLNFAYQLLATAPPLTYTAASGGGDPLNTGTYTADATLNYAVTTPATGLDTIIDGTLPANQAAKSDTLTGLNWAPGTYLLLRWQDTNNGGGNDGSLAIDNLSVNATTTPEPSSLTLVAVSGVALATRRRRRARR